MSTKLSTTELKRLERLAKVHTPVGVAGEIDKLEERVEVLENQPAPEKGEDGYTPIKGVDYFDGKDGENGKDYILTKADKKEIADSIEPKIVEKEVRVIEKTEVIKEQPIVTEIVKEVAVTDNAERLVEKLQTVEGEWLDKSAVKGLVEEIKQLRAELATKANGRNGAGKKITYTKRYNLTSQLDGVTKSFVLPSDTIEVIGVWGTQFPINFNPGTDWTFSGRTLTLTSEVSAPEAGQTLYCLIETLFYG